MSGYMYCGVKYPSSVNRGYFSCPQSLWQLHSFLHCIHPLSIEAISPAHSQLTPFCPRQLVSILCQSRLFLLRGLGFFVKSPELSIHPLSIEAISPAGKSSIVPVVSCRSIHPLSIEAISPACSNDCANAGQLVWYPSSVNRGYFSCTAPTLASSFVNHSIHPLSIEAISPAVDVTWDNGASTQSIHPLSIEAISPAIVPTTAPTLASSCIHPLSIEAISPA